MSPISTIRAATTDSSRVKLGAMMKSLPRPTADASRVKLGAMMKSLPRG
jgi:hypothetical protein